MAGYEPDPWQEHKDGVATGHLNEDGTQREPDEPDFGREEWERYAAMSLPGRVWHVMWNVAGAWWWLVRERINPAGDEPPF